jgi:hypothetical protein
LTLHEDQGDTFNVTVYFQSSVRVIGPQTVTVLTSDNVSYSFDVKIQLNLGEKVTFHASWTAMASEAGAYNVSLLAFSDDPNMDSNSRSVEDISAVRVVEDAPVISSLDVSDSYTAQEIDPRATFLYPDHNIKVRCNATSVYGIENVTIYYSTDQGVSWGWKAMEEGKVASEWVASLPKQADGTSLRVYVAAFGLLGAGSRTGELVFQVADLHALDVGAKTVMASTMAALVLGSLAYLLWWRRKMNDAL